MKKEITSILTRLLLGLVAIDAILIVIGAAQILVEVIYLAVWPIVIVLNYMLLVGGLCWVFLLATYIPELIAIRSAQGAMVLAHWRMVQDISFLPISVTNTCTGTTEVIEDLTSGIPGSRSSY